MAELVRCFCVLRLKTYTHTHTKPALPQNCLSTQVCNLCAKDRSSDGLALLKPFLSPSSDLGLTQVLDVARSFVAGNGECTASGSEACVPTGPVRVAEEPSMAAEDFSFYGREVPSVFTFLGIGDAERGTDVSLHNSRFKMDDRQMALGAAIHAATALEYMERNRKDADRNDEL